MCRDSAGEPSGDHSGDFQVVLFQHDHVRVAMKALVAEAECGDLYPRLRQIFGGTVVVNRMIGSLGRDDGGRDIDKISKGPRRRLLLPAANQIRSIRVCLLFDLYLRRVVRRRIIGDRDVGNPPSPSLVGA